MCNSSIQIKEKGEKCLFITQKFRKIDYTTGIKVPVLSRLNSLKLFSERKFLTPHLK